MTDWETHGRDARLPDWETVAWPRAEHLHRVFQVKSGTNIGTASAIDIDGRQYLVGALHVVESAIGTATLEIYQGNVWKPFPFDLVGINFEADVAVYALKERIVPPDLPIDIDSRGCIAGQEVFFLGYPLGIRGHPVGPGFPLPVIKRGVLALFDPGPLRSIYISASANPGFSGGPVYFPHRDTGRATLVGIIVEALGYEVPVKNADGENIGTVLTDSNLVRCNYIDHALDLIRAKPIGFKL
jgi:S1-C subfamily serine protease